MELRDLQAAIEAFINNHDLALTPDVGIVDLTAEVGELAKEVLKSTDYGEQEAEYTDTVGDEIGDVLYSLINLANAYDVDLEESLEKTIKKYQRRIQQGGIGSEFAE
jgi:NTP pyrophosphatase (non-canonical NTP hydrolase)